MIKSFALLSARLVKRGTLKVYPGSADGTCTTRADVINPDLLAFIKAEMLSATSAPSERTPQAA